MIQQEYYEYGLPASPNVLPSLFYGLHNVVLRSPSPSRLSVKSVFSQRKDEGGLLDQRPSAPSPDSISICQHFLIHRRDASGLIFSSFNRHLWSAS
jgi:hypothetical protein